MGVRARATIRLLLTCDNRCVFCAQDGLDAGRVEPLEARLGAARSESDAVTFVGGEPTLDVGLASHVAAARALSFRRIGVQTNGGRFADASYVESLVRAGLTDVHFSVHGDRAAVHDYHTGIPGSFDRALSAIAASRASRIDVAVTTVLTRSNCRVLGALPRLLASRGVAAWLISVPHAAGRAARVSDRVIPRLGLAIPFALHALDAAHAVALPAWIEGAPSCMLGRFATRALTRQSRAYGAACAECEARPACPGVDAAYLGRFGGDELARCARIAPSEAHVEISSMFVGVGDLARVSPPADLAQTPPAQARVALPMLGKVKPAIAEVPSSTERKTGEALRAIFPALFEGGASGGDSKR